MSEIPNDIIAAAEEALDNMLCNCIEASGSAAAFRKDSITDIAKAIMAERERALKIVAEIVAESGMTHEHDGEGAIVENVCDDIATAIRTQKEN